MFQKSLRVKFLMKYAKTSQRILAAMSHRKSARMFSGRNVSRDVCRDVPEVIEGQV